MTFRSLRGLAMAAFAVLGSFGCAAAPPPNASSDVPAPRDLYPLVIGNAWSYEVDTGNATTTLAITRVQSADGDNVEVRTGSSTIRYEVRAEGIRVPAEDVWLLRVPLRIGATWSARGGRTATLVSLDAVADTPAGAFRHCAEVLEQGGELDLEVRTTYCPGVGPVVVTSTMRSDVSERSLTVTAQLRGYEVSPR